MWVQTKSNRKRLKHTLSVLVAAINNALWHFHPTRLKQFEPKTTRPKSALMFSLDVSKIHPATPPPFLISMFFLNKGKYHLAHFGTHFMEEATTKNIFLMSNASDCLRDAYESAHYIWRKTFFATWSSWTKSSCYIHKITVLIFDSRAGVTMDGGSQFTECLCQLS